MSADLVKSAARALEILEVFASERRRMSLTQLQTLLGYPKSSLSVLLKSLVAQGYLATGGPDQDFFPTLKLSRLGDWIPAALLGSEDLLPLLERLRDETQETVTLTIASDLHMRCVHALIGTHPISLQVEEGVSFPMIGTAIGTMYLATRDEAELKNILGRWQRLHPGHAPTMDDTRHAIDHARRDGIALAFDAVIPDTGAIAIPIETLNGAGTMVVAVAGLNSRIKSREAQICSALQKLFSHLRPASGGA
jgi:DNA-binding IclR family transcriptional regulator